MRRYRKRELLEAISTLEKVNDAMIRSFSSNIPIKNEELAQCQELAIAVGNVLETSAESSEKIVGILEDYCEALYQLSIASADADGKRKLAKKIQRQLHMIENGIRYDLPAGKKEIVFLPYKVSMWDAFESVWRAASEDGSCEALVVPIPYFDKHADGSLGQMHYEGGQYPKDVPVVSWKEYNISERRPDVIYIHNPYDKYNYITSVHPDYYAAELKKYTDLLVYIPYFINVNDKGREDFCRTPGVFCADKVIVQSEAVRKFYVQELYQCEREYNCKGAFGNIESKILALGNPKYDRVTAIKKEDKKLPDEWSRLILFSDGKRKKVILYNTTIDGLLKHDERMLEKIKSVFAQFRKRGDAVLLWRPHPLLLTTLKSMRPQLVEEYQDMVETYRQEGFGIFDDYPDMYRAIAVSDAYFGDMSSVAELYKKTGKPILIQTPVYGEVVGLAFEAFAKADDSVGYASCAMFNGLFKVDLDTGDCTYLRMFPGEDADICRLHSRAWHADGRIYFASLLSEKAAVYDIAKDTIDMISKDSLNMPESDMQTEKPVPYEAGPLEEPGFGVMFLCEIGKYRYFVKFKGEKLRKKPFTWNFCQYFRLDMMNDSLERWCWKFAEGKETFAADHKEYLEQIKTGQDACRETMFYGIDDFLKEVFAANKKEGELMERTCQAEEVSVGKAIHRKIMEISG